MREPGYEDLGRILEAAFDQSATGKGRIRHANDKAFKDQPIMEIARMVGLGGHSYQICKKAQEATSMAGRGDYDAALAEFKGVIIYAAAAILLTEENKLKAENPMLESGEDSVVPTKSYGDDPVRLSGDADPAEGYPGQDGGIDDP